MPIGAAGPLSSAAASPRYSTPPLKTPPPGDLPATMPPIPRRKRSHSAAQLTDAFTPPVPHQVKNRSLLHTAIVRRQCDQIDSLLADKHSLQAVDSDGQTPLHCAAASNDVRTIERLLAAGADPAALDNWGDTPMDTAATAGHSGAAMLLNQALGKSDRQKLWPNPQHVHAVLQAFASTNSAPGYAQIDRLVEALSGTHLDLNTCSDMLKYVGHLYALRGAIGGEVDAEGWYQVPFLYQRLRSVVAMYVAPAPLPKGLASFSPIEIRALLEREIVGILASLNVRRHIANFPSLSAETRCALQDTEAARVLHRVSALGCDEELTLPLGLPSHALYVSFHRASKQAGHGVTVRLDNLGSGYSKAHPTDENGKVSPFSFTIPLAYYTSHDGHKRLKRMVATLIDYKSNPDADMGMIYAQLLLQVRLMQRKFPGEVRACVDASEHYWKNKQSVGNCCLKNHNAGVWSRFHRAAQANVQNEASGQAQKDAGAMTHDLWHWFKAQEIDLAVHRLCNFVMTPKFFEYQSAKKKRLQLSGLLADEKTRRTDVLAHFLCKPKRDHVAIDLTAENLLPLVCEGNVETLALLLDRGVCLQDQKQFILGEGSSLLHAAVRSHAPRAAAVIELLLGHGADPNAVDAEERTPFMLAAHLGRIDALLTLQNHDAAASADPAVVEALLQKQLVATQLAIRALRIAQAPASQGAAPPASTEPAGAAAILPTLVPALVAGLPTVQPLAAVQPSPWPAPPCPVNITG